MKTETKDQLPPQATVRTAQAIQKKEALKTEEIPCPNCYGGHFRPCQWCGDSGRIVTVKGGAS